MMEEFKRPQINITKNLKIPNYYTLALENEFSEYAFSEERAPLNKGAWREKSFKESAGDFSTPMDLEIGTGNGVHFQFHCLKFPERKLVGLELKYKPLIQTIRGTLRRGAQNGRIARYHAFNLDQLFVENEIDNIYIHFPDPWVTPRKPKNRIMQPRMLDLFYRLQKPGSFIEFKTDSREAFLWSLENIQKSKYQIQFQTLNLHSGEAQAAHWASQGVITQFERIFMKQNVEINYIRLQKLT